MNNFWETLPKPIIVLAPMADVTDTAFRRVIAKYGKPDVMWTEFVSADGLYHTRELKKLSDAENPLMQDLIYDESERPIVAQLFSAKPEMMEYAARVVTKLGFDGVDINMGCPDRSVEKQGSGAALMKNPALARELIKAAKRGTGDKIPVSVKTRIGYSANDLETWLPELLKEDPALITVHARTRKELSDVPARWEHVREAVVLRSKLRNNTLIFGNGDVANPAEAMLKAEETGADGVMIGRGIFGNPWLFAELQNARTRHCEEERRSNPVVPSLAEKLAVLVEHCRYFEELCSHKSFAVMKKHFKAYIHGFSGAAELRAKLMECNNADEVCRVVDAAHL